jgi:hypothetical protein
MQVVFTGADFTATFTADTNLGDMSLVGGSPGLIGGSDYGLPSPVTGTLTIGSSTYNFAGSAFSVVYQDPNFIWVDLEDDANHTISIKWETNFAHFPYSFTIPYTYDGGDTFALGTGAGYQFGDVSGSLDPTAVTVSRVDGVPLPASLPLLLTCLLSLPLKLFRFGAGHLLRFAKAP